jgi:hypothetical protein
MLDTTFTSIDMFQTHTTCQIVIPSLLPILTPHLPSSAQQMSVHRSTVCEVAKPSGLHGPNCMACHNERMIKRIGRKKTIWNVRQNATWHRKQNPRYIPDKMSDKLLEYVWNGCADHLSHVQNCRQLILVFGGIYSSKNWMASHARKLFTSFAQAHLRASFAHASRKPENT